MYTIVCSTNRNNSVSKKIALLYQSMLAEREVEAEVIDLTDLPEDFIASALYEKSGKNDAFNPYRERMLESEKFVFIIPEYNGSFPGVLKAFIDGLDFPGTFTGKKAALVGLSAGVQGAGLAMSHMTDILNYCGTHVVALKPKLARIGEHMDDEDLITNKLYNELLNQQADMLIAF